VSIRARISSDSIRVISDLGSIRVITVSGRFGFGSVSFRISDQHQFNPFSCRYGSGFGSFGFGSAKVRVRSTSSEAHLDGFGYGSGQSRFRSIFIMNLGQCWVG